MSGAFAHLLSPGRIGTMELRNRIILSPMGDDLCHEDGTVSAAQLGYAEARARGGAALVMLGSVAVAHPLGTSNGHQSGISDDRFIPGLRQVADAVHAHGARLGLQLVHAGKMGINDSAAGRPMWVPSVPEHPAELDPLFAMTTVEELDKQTEPFTRPEAKVEYQVMTTDEIATATGWFAAAARRARQAGVDGIELHAGHGYLIDEFLSPATNVRTDDYGGPIENRARFLVETLRAIRAEVGDNYPVWCRINGHEYFVEGTTIDDARCTAELAVQAGANAIHVSAYADPNRAIGFTEAHTTQTPNGFVDFARAVKEVVDVPVIAVGRIDPSDADRLISEGAFDFVAMGRKLLADPDLPNKLAAGQADEVRPCMYHYRCIGQIFIREGVRCAINPATGREAQFTLSPATHPKRVLVIGGGPAGMEAARIATLRGHTVTLHEAGERLGGKLALAAKTYAPNADVLRWLLGQVDRLGIDVQLNARLTAIPEGFDEVVLASGGRWLRPDVPGATAANVRTVDELEGWLLGGEPLAGQRVVVLGGGRAGCGVADLASRQGYQVSVVEPGAVLASQIGLPGRWRLVHDLGERGVDLRPNTTATAIADGEVRVAGPDGDDVLGADVVISAGTIAANLGLADSSAAAPIHPIGDCATPGFIEAAMLTAAQVAMQL